VAGCGALFWVGSAEELVWQRRSGACCVDRRREDVHFPARGRRLLSLFRCWELAWDSGTSWVAGEQRGGHTWPEITIRTEGVHGSVFHKRLQCDFVGDGVC
jgi:hypothetical protein